MTSPVTSETRIIEFVGLSGAGKSTIASLVVSELRRRGLPVKTRGDLILTEAPLLQRTLVRLRWMVGSIGSGIPGRAVRLVWQSKPRSFRDWTKSFWSLGTITAVIAGAREERDGSVLVLDQGLLQSVWSTGMSGTASPSSMWRKAFGSLLGPDYVIVVVDVSPAAARERLSGRTICDSRMQDPERLADQALWDQTDRLLQQLVRETKASDRDSGLSPVVIHVDAERLTAAENARHIVDTVLPGRPEQTSAVSGQFAYHC